MTWCHHLTEWRSIAMMQVYELCASVGNQSWHVNSGGHFYSTPTLHSFFSDSLLTLSAIVTMEQVLSCHFFLLRLCSCICTSAFYSLMLSVCWQVVMLVPMGQHNFTHLKHHIKCLLVPLSMSVWCSGGLKQLRCSSGDRRKSSLHRKWHKKEKSLKRGIPKGERLQTNKMRN